jgi:hypothetical protein
MPAGDLVGQVAEAQYLWSEDSVSQTDSLHERLSSGDPDGKPTQHKPTARYFLLRALPGMYFANALQ